MLSHSNFCNFNYHSMQHLVFLSLSLTLRVFYNNYQSLGHYYFFSKLRVNSSEKSSFLEDGMKVSLKGINKLLFVSLFREL
jgi:hypothetical protein